LIATILSAQCTDERVNMVTPALFKRFPTARAMAAADPAELEELIRSTGFYRNKTKSILGASVRLTEVFGGKVPQTMEALLTLPGVARKTANVVLGSAFGMNEGVVVDTHVQRLSQRMGLSKEHDPAKVERDLMALFPREEWTDLSHRLILHGRQVCNARLPRCGACVLGPDACPSYQPEAAGWKSGKAERAKKSASRMVGPYLGLTRKRDQSGEVDKELRITKRGDEFLRRLLVSAAQYILGPLNKQDSALRRFGLRLAQGGKRAKKRAVVAVARKLAVLLHRLWVTGEVYEPLRAAESKEAA